MSLTHTGRTYDRGTPLPRLCAEEDCHAPATWSRVCLDVPHRPALVRLCSHHAGQLRDDETAIRSMLL